jgi:hypothetical protein
MKGMLAARVARVVARIWGAEEAFRWVQGRLSTFVKQETYTTTVIRDGGAWSLPPTNLGLIL